jgi:hypothetical protein
MMFVKITLIMRVMIFLMMMMIQGHWHDMLCDIKSVLETIVSLRGLNFNDT